MARRSGLFLVLLLSTVRMPAAGPQAAQMPSQQRPVDYCAVPSDAPPNLPAVLMEGMGPANFPITTRSAEAQAFFNQGIAQVHSFWFREAERSFRQVAELDPDAAMAYWGIALSAGGDYRPAFQSLRNRSAQAQRSAEATTPGQPRAVSPSMARSREAIARAMELRDKVSERERLYIEAMAARRTPDSRTATEDYIQGLRKLVAAYPDDLDAKSMLALAIQNGYEPVTRKPRDGTLESLALIREILKRDPDHAGAHHYMIHGAEGGPMPQEAWDSCKRYAELTPNIPHALHMPGHIYAQSGRLEDAVHAFTSAALNELGYMSADTLYGNGHYAHNHHFLVHTLGLQGRYLEAVTRSKEIMQQRENPRERASVDGGSAYRQGWFALMKTLVRFEKWDEILEGKLLPVYDKPRENAWRHWAQGLSHAAKGSVVEAQASLAAMDEALEKLKSASAVVPPQIEAARTELDGYVQVVSGEAAKGLERMRKAARQEAELLYTEPPAYPRPVLEMLGRAELQTGNYAAAEKTYRELLVLEPGNGRALWGISQALKGAGRLGEADKVYAEFLQTWSSADTGVAPR